MQLRLTRQALRDLDLSIEKYSKKSATEYVDANDMVASFVRMRSQSPVGQETTRLPVTRATVWNIHHGRCRGLTWHDVNADVVWLLGVGWHESDSIDDANVQLKDRDVRDRLMPTVDDYRDLELTESEISEFITQVSIQAPSLIEVARRRPGEEVQGVIAERIKVSVLVYVVRSNDDSESLVETFISFEMPPIEGPCVLPTQPEWIQIVLAAMLPEAEVNRFSYGANFPRSEALDYVSPVEFERAYYYTSESESLLVLEMI